MSTLAFVQGPKGVVAAWDTDEQIFFTTIKPGTADFTAPQSAPGSGGARKHPAVAMNARGEMILVWTEGTGWNRGGAVAWQVYDKDGKPTAEKGRTDGVPAWSLVAVFARADGAFSIIY
jgi:hypothetical protein